MDLEALAVTVITLLVAVVEQKALEPQQRVALAHFLVAVQVAEHLIKVAAEAVAFSEQEPQHQETLAVLAVLVAVVVAEETLVALVVLAASLFTIKI
jgi:hypothetical protein